MDIWIDIIIMMLIGYVLFAIYSNKSESFASKVAVVCMLLAALSIIVKNIIIN